MSPPASKDETNLRLTDDQGCSLVRETLDEEEPILIDPSFDIPDGDLTLIVVFYLSTLILLNTDSRNRQITLLSERIGLNFVNPRRCFSIFSIMMTLYTARALRLA